MTNDLPSSEAKKRRFSALDIGVGFLAICSLAAPFAARLQVEAHASGPKVAVRAEVSPIRPIDIELGYNERRAEAAFFEGLDQPLPSPADTALDLALAAPRDNSLDSVPAPEPLVQNDGAAATIDGPSLDDLLAEQNSSPDVMRTIAVLSLRSIVDFIPTGDVSDTPPVAARQKVEPQAQVRVTMSVPPTMTPLPSLRKRAHVPENNAPTVLNLSDGVIERDAPGATFAAIEEAPLDPLPALEPINTVALDTAVIEVDALPSDVTPAAPKETPVVVADASPAPARPPVTLKNGPKIALVIAAAGINSNVTDFAIEALPAGVTLAFAPVKSSVTAQARQAKADGHSVLVEIPMEPVNKTRDPGPLTLRVGDTAQQNLARLNQALEIVPFADGASTYLGARFNADERSATPIIRALASKGLFLFENEPTTRSVFKRLSAGSDLPYARGIIKIDTDRNGAAIREMLTRLERQAKRDGYAVGVGTALRGTISTVALWAKAAEKRGVQLVPIRELAR